jgi:adenylyltransferase/sulfurtransferase
VQISATLRPFVGRNAFLTLEGKNVAEITAQLRRQHAPVREAFYEDDGSLRPFVALYLNGQRLTLPQDEGRPLQEGDTLLFLPVIAGGKEGLISDQRRKEVTLDDKEIQRYSNHLLLKEVGVKGQKKLKAARVLVAGLGALGSPVVQYLAAAGVGTLGLADSRKVDLADIQSQPLHGTRDVRRPRTASAKDRVKAINPLVQPVLYQDGLTAENIEGIIQDYDLVVDATDNHVSRYLINDACALAGIPLVYGAIYQTEGRVTVFDAKSGPCLRCQFPAPPPPDLVPSCASGGVVSPLPGVIGSLMAEEAVKLLLGQGEDLIGTMLLHDSWQGTFQRIRVGKDEGCPLCGRYPTIFDVTEIDYEDLCGLKEGDEAPIEGLTPEELADRIDRGDPLTLIDVREPHERSIMRFPGAIVMPIGQLARRQKELDPDVDTIFICREGKRSVLAIRTLREAGYKGPMYNLKGGIEAAKSIVLAHEGGWL